MLAWLQEFHKWHGRDKKSRVHMVRPWSPSTNGWAKVNFDEAWDEDTGTGGVRVKIRSVTAVLAHVEFEGDALMVIKALQHERFDDNSLFGHIIADT
ncbi:hypothetical protein ACFX1W_035256 [Malus domestica]